jgi:putative RNA 2'-phosphotransferase
LSESLVFDNMNLSEKEVTKISKLLSLVLRHKPETISIVLDENGWTNVNMLLEKMSAEGLRLDREELNFIVATNSKKRFAFNDTGDKIRASQGHSIDVELNYEPAAPPGILYHGTASHNVNSILSIGLEKRNRQHVHLSKDVSTALTVGQRHGKPIIFEVRTGEMHEDGFIFYLSENGVWLTDNVPAKYLQHRVK